MKRVTGLGGIFFKTSHKEKTMEWYKKHLDIRIPDIYGGIFEWREKEDPGQVCYTVWSPFPQDTNYFEPSKREFMINYRVDDLEGLIRVLKEEGVEVVGEIQEFDYGKFGWIMDPEGNKIELWEPKDKVFEDYYKDK